MRYWDRLNGLMFPLVLIAVIIGTTAASWGATPQLAAGAYHTLKLRSDGTIWASGINTSGQLGDGSLTNSTSPVQVGTGNDWVAVACGADHNLAIKADGSLWGWGDNTSGQLGDGSKSNRKSPVRIGTANDWRAVAAGGTSSFALKANGTLWAWGRNNNGQLGTGDAADRLAPVQVANLGGSPYAAVSTGGDHALALQANGTLWTWGGNQFGQLGDGTTAQHATPAQVDAASDWTAISAGGLHSLAMKADGTLWSWGDNGSGQLGDGTTAQRTAPARVGVASDWNAISAGDLHSLAVKRDGTLWGWGDNTGGQLGDGTATNSSVPQRINGQPEIADVVAVAAGAAHSLAAKANGEIYGWGDNGTGQLGSGSAISAFSPIQAGKDVIGWVGSEPGGAFTLARRSDGTLWSWGDNSSGQLGDGTLTARPTPAVVGTAGNWVAQAAGWSHAVALAADGTLWSWGDNSSGQLGDSTSVNRRAPVQITVTQPASAPNGWKAVAAGDVHTLALQADGTLWAWGRNSSGQLGDGTTTNRQVPVRVVTGNPGGFDRNWVAVAAGRAFSLALQANGTLWAWGDNASGQLGDPNFGAGVNPPQLTSPRQVVNFAPPTPGYNSSWVAIAAGLDHSLALQSDGSLWAWGSNFTGQLGNGDATLPHPPVQSKPVLVLNPGAAPYVAVTAGDSHSVARQADGSLWAWGNDTSGQLGNGASDPDRFHPIPHPTPIREVTGSTAWGAIASGGSHSVALKAESLWAWGNNVSVPTPLTGGRASVAPTFAFGFATIGATGSQELTIANSGAAPLVVSSISLAGTNGAMFGLSAGNCGNVPFTVPQGGSCKVGITLTPTAPVGVKNATLSAATSDPNSPTVTVAISGNAILPFTVTATADANGSISGPNTANYGATPSYVITPNAGYHVSDVKLNGASKGAVTTLTLPAVTANQTIAATFAINAYSITANAGANGSITGPATANYGDTPGYTITANTGYHIQDVTVNGASKGTAATLTLPAVTANQTIAATFALNTYTITAENDAKGTISPSGPVSVNHGANQTFTFVPKAGYGIVNVVVDGVSKGSVSSYTFTGVTSGGHTIRLVSIPEGDSNNDGTVDIADALLALRMAVGLETLTEARILHADVSPQDAGGIPVPDKKITVGDALLILRKVVGLASGW